jgi:3-hydroxyanthranilate 3,4-dioxygenase
MTVPSGIQAIDVLQWIKDSQKRQTDKILNHDTFWNRELIVKMFDGPTPVGRSDFHINTSPELFYQFEGDMFCRLLQDGKFQDHTVGPGQLFYIPPLVPHLNARRQGSIGLAIHQQRSPGALDAVAWYCESCGNQLYRADYLFKDLLEQLPPLVRAFLADEEKRTCGSCGWKMPADQGRM